MTYDSVAWDFDGVLADSRAEAWRAASEILALVGIEVEIRSQETFRKYFTRSGVFRESETVTLRGMHRLVMNSRALLVKLFPCISLVARLSVPSEVVTSGLATVAHKVLGEHANSFVRIRGREDDSKEGLLRTVSDDAICVTDTVVDVARCRQLPRVVIAVGWGYDPIDALKDSAPDFFVESPPQLEELFEHLALLRRNTPQD
jgi:phosphoglycolate phosphatase-like HAD superfamily hydrolase